MDEEHIDEGGDAQPYRTVSQELARTLAVKRAGHEIACEQKEEAHRIGLCERLENPENCHGDDIELGRLDIVPHPQARIGHRCMDHDHEDDH